MSYPGISTLFLRVNICFSVFLFFSSTCGQWISLKEVEIQFMLILCKAGWLTLKLLTLTHSVSKYWTVSNIESELSPSYTGFVRAYCG